jgi:hypothetical protein
MGLRFRKSFSCGPVRVTLSKKGVSTSIGTKGARITKKANGKTQTTLSIPNSGISYTSTTSSKKSNKKEKEKTMKEKNIISNNNTSYFKYVPDTNIEESARKNTLKDFFIIIFGITIRLFISLFFLLLFNAPVELVPLSLVWSLFYTVRYNLKKMYLPLKEILSYEEFEGELHNIDMYSFIEFLNSEQLKTYKFIIDFVGEEKTKVFNPADINSTNLGVPISKSMFEKLYELGYLIKPVKGKYSLNLDKYNYYKNLYESKKEEKRKQYEIIKKECDEYNYQTRLKNLELYNKRFKGRK